MDLNDIWQEHKRWILGVLAGVVVFFVGRSIVGAVFDPTPFRATARTIAGTTNKAELYTKKAQTEANAEKAEVQTQASEAKKKTEFAPADDLDIAGKPGSLAVHYNSVTSEVRKKLLAHADRINVRIDGARELGLPPNSPTDRDEIQRVLTGLDLVRQTLTRLFATAEKVREQHEDAIALHSVQKIQIQVRSGARRGAAPTPGKQRSVEDLVEEVNVAFEFRADSPTVIGLLESFRSESRPILVDKLKIEEGKEQGDPLVVSLTLVGLRIREEGT